MFMGLASMARPLDFERYTAFIVQLIRDELKLDIEIDASALGAAALNFEEVAGRLMRPTPVHVLDAYARALGERPLLKASPASYWLERSVVPEYVTAFCRNPTHAFAVLASLHLFSREVEYEETEYQVPLRSAYLVGYRIKRSPNRHLFQISPLDRCREIAGANRSLAIARL